MILDELITDRSASDVNSLKAILKKLENISPAEWEKLLENSKGAYNASDMNRVGEAALYVAREFETIGEICTIEMKTNWTHGELVTTGALQKYMDNLRTLHDAVTIRITNLPTTVKNINDANDIEQMLLDIHDIIYRQLAFLFYNGDLYSGEV